MSRKINVSTPGKVILSGEHAVVYGYPAILAAVNRRLLVRVEKSDSFEVIPVAAKDVVKHSLRLLGKKFGEENLAEVKISISSQIPIGCGMGSSAAFAVGISAGIFELLKQPRNLAAINECAYEIEKRQHGNPSGGDNTVATYGGFLWYRKETENFKTFSFLTAKISPRIFIINTGRPEEKTGEMVMKVRDLYSRSHLKVEKIFQEIEATTRVFLKFLLGEEIVDFKELIRTNEKLLEELGVVSPLTKLLIRKIEKIGGAAKISGAGGVKKGSGIVLAYHEEPEILIAFAKKRNLDISKVKLGEVGLKYEGAN